MIMRRASTFLLAMLFMVFCSFKCASDISQSNTELRIETGAEQTHNYLPYLKDKRVAIVANQTSIIDSVHLVDTLLSLDVDILTIFAPEHGFKGNYAAGIVIKDDSLSFPDIDIISLYGAKTIPSHKDLSDIDIVLFDIQDVGCRFYTYINVLRDIMYACARDDKELFILDRPNPNGYLIDGPVLTIDLKSGIGQFPIPIAYGMTIAEFAQMINGECWLKDSLQCPLKIISLKNYSHKMEYILPVPPSPNLNTHQAIMLYPSTCLFEGTILNHGRGTLYPFTVLGSPKLQGIFEFSFLPQSIPGMSEAPIYMNEVCYGIDLRGYNIDLLRDTEKLNIRWIIDLYNIYPEKDDFFNSNFSNQIGDIDLLAGTREFKEQIRAGKTVYEIRNSWEPELSEFKEMRKKYLIYP